MNNKSADKTRGVSAAFSRLFTGSLTSGIPARLRIAVLSLRLRVIGVFLFTFGVYSLAASLITHFFTDRAVGDGAVYFGVCLAAASVPLLISNDNISSCLTDSYIGRGLCGFLGIQADAARRDSRIGRLNAGFILGVIAGTLTLIFSPLQIISFISAAAASVVILSVPRVGPVVNMAGLLIFDIGTHCFIIIITLLSFLIKQVRGKQSIRPRRADAIPLIFMLSVIGGFAFSMYHSSAKELVGHIAVISPYLLCVFLYSDCRRINRLAAVACISAALVSCAYTAGYLIGIVFRGAVTDSGALISAVASLYVFKTGVAPSLLAALIPLSAGQAMLRRGTAPRSVMWLCTGLMLCVLVIMNDIPCLTAAAISSAVLLLIIGRKSIYIALTLLLGLFSVTIYTDIGGRILSKLLGVFTEVTADTEVSFQRLGSMGGYILFGKGFSGSREASGLYYEITEAIGIIGLVVFAVFIVCVIFSFTELAKRTLSPDIALTELQRFDSICSGDDTRTGAAAPLAACISLLICGMFNRFGSCSPSFMLIWILCGMCVSYSRSAVRELNKAREAAYFRFSADEAALSIPVSSKTRRK